MNCTEIERLIDVFSEVQRENKFRSIWSLFEIEDFTKVPYPDAHRIQYIDHGGFYTVVKDIPNNSTWLDLWKIADECIEESGDNHHIFIEAICDVGNGILELRTGS